MLGKRIRILGLVFVLPVVACSGASSDAATSGAVVTGQLQLSAYALSEPTVVAQDSSGAFFAAKVDDDGKFELEVPSGKPVRLSVASGTSDGAFNTISRIRAVDSSDWASFEDHARVELGVISPAGASDTDDTDAASGDDDGELDDSDGKLCVPPQSSPEAELPYAVELAEGQSFKLSDAFALKGGQPSAVVRVTMDGAPWHLTELQTGAAFTVTAADCVHPGNRDVGRDRVFVTWQNADGSLATDHLDLRYCKDGSSGTSGATVDAGVINKDHGGKGGDDSADDDRSGHEAEAGEDDGTDDDKCGPGEKSPPVCSTGTKTRSHCQGANITGVKAAAAPVSISEPACAVPVVPPAPPAPPVTPPAPPSPPIAI